MDVFARVFKNNSILPKKMQAALYLMRPANIMTAFADILAGFFIATTVILNSTETVTILSLLLLLLSTAGLYAGGIVLNDVCDAKLDSLERPERPIPQGLISKRQALYMTIIFFLIGIAAAFAVNFISGLIATAIALLCVTYDTYTKHHLWLGPINMGLCRGFNLLLGMSIVTSSLASHSMLMIIPFLFISAITLMSKTEVKGGHKNTLLLVFILYTLTTLTVVSLTTITNFQLIYALPYLILFTFLAFKSLIKAMQITDPHNIKKAVKMGIICLILLDASLAAGFAHWWSGLIILLLLPISFTLAKKFSVT